MLCLRLLTFKVAKQHTINHAKRKDFKDISKVGLTKYILFVSFLLHLNRKQLYLQKSLQIKKQGLKEL